MALTWPISSIRRINVAVSLGNAEAIVDEVQVGVDLHPTDRATILKRAQDRNRHRVVAAKCDRHRVPSQYLLLGAPVGSAVAGESERIVRARRERKFSVPVCANRA